MKKKDVYTRMKEDDLFVYKLVKARSEQIKSNGVCFHCDKVRNDDGTCYCSAPVGDQS